MIAVISGDIIESRGLKAAIRSNLKQYLETARSAATAIAAEHLKTPLVLSPLAFRGGDGWQLALRPAWLGVRFALAYHCFLRGAEAEIRTRLSIAIGPSALASLDLDLNLQQEEPFVASGEALEAQSNADRLFGLALVRGEFSEADQYWADAWSSLAEVLVRAWTERQCEVLGRAFFDQTQAGIARSLRAPVTQQTVSKHLESASFSPLARSLEGVESYLRESTS